jgi:hypothetical protein
MAEAAHEGLAPPGFPRPAHNAARPAAPRVRSHARASAARPGRSPRPATAPHRPRANSRTGRSGRPRDSPRPASHRPAGSAARSPALPAAQARAASLPIASPAHNTAAGSPARPSLATAGTEGSRCFAGPAPGWTSCRPGSRHDRPLPRTRPGSGAGAGSTAGSMPSGGRSCGCGRTGAWHFPLTAARNGTPDHRVGTVKVPLTARLKRPAGFVQPGARISSGFSVSQSFRLRTVAICSSPKPLNRVLVTVE